jgi:anti-sigma B factor antagonist
MRSGLGSDGGIGATSFSVDVHQPDGKRAELVVRGDLDMVSAQHLAERAEEATGREVVVDLSAVTFMDSTGLRALWTLRQNVSSHGGRVLLRDPSASVMRVLKTTKLDKVFDYADGRAV